VVLEGIDGSGKTSVGKEVVTRLMKAYGIKAVFTFEPSDLPVGRLLREVLSGDHSTDPHTHALLFAADREEHLRIDVLPTLHKGITVICDRYVYASMAYQGAKGVSMEEIWRMNTRLPHFIIPDLTLLLDLPPDVSLKRTSDRESADIFERPDYLTKVRDNYLSMIDDHRIMVIDASVEFERVVEAVTNLIVREINSQNECE